MPDKITVGLLAGEASGDNLGAGLMAALKQKLSPHATLSFVGIGGERMRAQGLDSLYPIERLSVNGFRDPILKLPGLLKMLFDIRNEMIRRKVDVFVGIDFNVFNFLLEARLKRHGIPTVHYVSPSVYAWRRGRTRRVAKVADVVLCLFPFEPDLYAHTAVEAVFVGHPLADEIGPATGSDHRRQAAREQLGCANSAEVIALLPGSRSSEIKLMLPVFLEAARRISKVHKDAVFLIPYPRPGLKALIDRALPDYGDLRVQTIPGGARTVLQACDGALVKSGTSTLEAMLLRRPMVVSYRMGTFSYQLARRLIRSPYVSLPNILLGRMRVPELLQYEGTADALGAALLTELESARTRPDYFDEFDRLHATLSRQADASAAEAVLRLMGVGSR